MGLIDDIKAKVRPYVAKAVTVVEDHAPAVVKTAIDVAGVEIAPIAAVAHAIDPHLVPVLDNVLKRAPASLRTGVWVVTDSALLPNALNRPPLNAVPEAKPSDHPNEPGVSPTTTGNEITPLVDGPAYKQALLASIASAKSSIWLETYEWQDNATGKEIAQAIVDAKKKAKAEGRQLDVRLLYDNRANFAQLQQAAPKPNTPPPLLADLEKEGCVVRQTDYSALRVNHRKLSVFDGETTYVGGQNLGDNYLLPTSAGWTYHDMTQKVVGPAAYDAASVFADSWYRAGGERLSLPSRPKPRTGVGASAEVQVIRHSGGMDRNIERELVQRMDSEKGAGAEIVLANGFGMSDAIYEACKRARERGVKVTWLWGKASEASALMAQTRWADLQALGVDVRAYPGPLHMKAAYFKNADCMIQGSSNLDGFSTMVNDEAVLQIHGGDVPADFYKTVLAPDMAKSPIVTGPVVAAATPGEAFEVRMVERIADGDH
jgi:cardiolipin synthase